MRKLCLQVDLKFAFTLFYRSIICFRDKQGRVRSSNFLRSLKHSRCNILQLLNRGLNQVVGRFFQFFFLFFWLEVNEKILSQIKSCRSLSLTYCEVIVGFFEEEMDLFNYIVISGKSFLWTCRCRKILLSLSHFIRILEIKYETKKLVYFKLNKASLFKEKWQIFEDNILSKI